MVIIISTMISISRVVCSHPQMHFPNLPKAQRQCCRGTEGGGRRHRFFLAPPEPSQPDEKDIGLFLITTIYLLKVTYNNDYLSITNSILLVYVIITGSAFLFFRLGPRSGTKKEECDELARLLPGYPIRFSHPSTARLMYGEWRGAAHHR